MALAHWTRGDVLPLLPHRDALTISRETDDTLLAGLVKTSEAEIVRRRAAGNQPYVAWLAGVPVAYVWVATRSAHIGELDLFFRLPSGQVYLWDFATLPQWRGKGIYPHLLQGIVKGEVWRADHFWIIHAPENAASARGIIKAGFQPVGKLSFLKYQPAVGLINNGSVRAFEGGSLLGVDLLPPRMSHRLAPCWCCAISMKDAGNGIEPGCWLGACACSGE
jgi:GNAT superfamily N-acetyltransferase